MKKYYIKQKISGAIIAAIGIIMPIFDNGDITFTLLDLPLGLYLMTTKKQVIYSNNSTEPIKNTNKKRLKR